MKKVLITGGAGFIGSKLCLKLLEKGYQITVLDNLSAQIHGADALTNSSLYISIKDKIKFIHNSILCKDALQASIADNEIIIHLAAETGTGQSMYKIYDYVAVNINGTALLLDIIANTKNNVKKVIVASSRAIYGEGKYKSIEGNILYPSHRSEANLSNGIFEVLHPYNNTVLKTLPTDENSQIHPSSVYGITKQSQENLVMTVCQSIGIAAVAFRYQNVYGPGQSLQNPYTGILSIFSTLIKNKQAINIFEDGKESRDFVYIDDVVDATILGIENNAADNNVFNVGTGVATSVIDIAKQLLINYGIDVPLNISGNYRIGDIRHNLADLTKINKQLGFKPKVSFEQGIKKFTDWVAQQDLVYSNYEQSVLEMRQKGLLK